MCCSRINTIYIYMYVLFPLFGRRYDLRKEGGLLISGERYYLLYAYTSVRGFVCHKPIPFDSEPVNFRIPMPIYKGITSTPVFFLPPNSNNISTFTKQRTQGEYVLLFVERERERERRLAAVLLELLGLLSVFQTYLYMIYRDTVTNRRDVSLTISLLVQIVP